MNLFDLESVCHSCSEMSSLWTVPKLICLVLCTRLYTSSCCMAISMGTVSPNWQFDHNNSLFTKKYSKHTQIFLRLWVIGALAGYRTMVNSRICVSKDELITKLGYWSETHITSALYPALIVCIPYSICSGNSLNSCFIEEICASNVDCCYWNWLNLLWWQRCSNNRFGF